MARKSDNRVALNANITRDTKRALELLAERNRRSLTGEVEHMIMERAEAEGLWPERKPVRRPRRPAKDVAAEVAAA